MPRDTPSDDAAHIIEAINKLAEQQRVGNLIAYAKVAPNRTDAVRALKAARPHLNLSGDTHE